MAERVGLPLERGALVDVAASLAARREVALERALRLAARHADHRAVEEVILQAHLFVGFPLVLEAVRLWREMVPEAPPPPGEPSDEDAAFWRERGERVCAIVYGGNYEKLRANVARLHPALDEWMISAGYGRVLGRPALDLATRELCIAALLAVWDAPRQLHSHLRGAINAGAATSEVEAAVEIACRHLTAEEGRGVRAVLARVLPAEATEEG